MQGGGHSGPKWGDLLLVANFPEFLPQLVFDENQRPFLNNYNKDLSLTQYFSIKIFFMRLPKKRPGSTVGRGGGGVV